ncbi:MAG TPA: hypothetical protein VNG31_03465 [Candidatus Baltobacteraceae bacterium]|nr:hypothetical protein [Candidatus Baltobacteraceae bacterium]
MLLQHFHDASRRQQGALPYFRKRCPPMSDTQVTAIARLDERLTVLKERL